MEKNISILCVLKVSLYYILTVWRTVIYLMMWMININDQNYV